MELSDTIEAMTSTDYKKRFKAEYYQLEVRIIKLRNVVDNYEHLPFKPKCSRELLNSQLVSMLTYKSYLLQRAKIEDIELFDINNVSHETFDNKMYVNLGLTEKDIGAIQKAYDYVYCHYDLSTQNPDDREAVTTLMHLAELVTRG